MDEQEAADRARIVAVARSWLATPYHDCACVKGHGVDCAYLVKAIMEEAGLEPPIAVEPYSPQWFLHRSEEKYLSKVLERAVEIPEAQVLPGDVVLYRIGRCFAHGAVVVAWPTIIHAHKQSGIVTLAEGDQGDLAGLPRRFFTRKQWAAAN